MKAWLQRRFIKYLTKHLFNAVDIDDIFRSETFRDGRSVKTKVKFEDKYLDPSAVAKIQEKAISIKDSSFWKILRREIQYESKSRIYHKPESESDAIFGRAMLYNLEIIEKTLERLSKM